MVMIRKKGKALKIAQSVMKGKGIKVPAPRVQQDITLPKPQLQH